jgi:hypothetical protein
MAATSYKYDVIDDFPNDKVDNAALQYQVEQSAISSAAVTHVNTEWRGAPARNKCDVWFDDPLSPGDEAILDSVVAAHDGTPLENVTIQQGRLAFDIEGVEIRKDSTDQLRFKDTTTTEKTLAELATAGTPDLSKVVLEVDGSLVYVGDGDVTMLE